MNVLIDRITKLVNDEALDFNDKFGNFHSNYEGVSAIEAVAMQARQDMDYTFMAFQDLKKAIYKCDTAGIDEAVDYLSVKAVIQCAELMQMLALVNKFIVDRNARIEENGGKEKHLFID